MNDRRRTSRSRGLVAALLVAISGAGCAGGEAAIPRVPTGVAAVAGNRAVTLSFDADPSAKVAVYYATSAGVTKDDSRLVVESPFQQRNLENGTRVYYRVVAFNNVGESDLSAEVDAEPDAQATSPGAPASVTAVGADGQIIVNWGELPGATSYTVYRDSKPGVFPGNGTSLSTIKPPLIDSGLANGVTYYYVVTARRDGDESLPSAETSATANGTSAGLATPSGVSAQAGDAQVTLSWSTVQGASGYDIYFSTSPGVTPQNGSKLAATTSPYTHSSLTNGTTFYYVIVARRAAQRSMPSAEVSATPQSGITPPPPPPPPPQGKGSITGTLSGGAYGVVLLENLSGGTGLVQVQVYSADPQGSPPGQLLGGLSVTASGAISGALPAKSGSPGVYENVTAAPLQAGSYSFTVSGARSGTLSLTVNKLASCVMTAPQQSSAHQASQDLALTWTSQNSEKAQILVKDVLGTVTYPPQVPDPGGVVIPGTDIPNAGPLDVLVSAVWSVKASGAGGLFLGDCAVRVTLN